MSEAQLNTQRILWGALFASTFLYLGVVLVIDLPVAEAPPPAYLPVLLAVSALVIAIASMVFPERMARTALLALSLPLTERAAEETMFAERPRRPRRFAEPAIALARAIPIGQTALILGMALAEAVALNGFVVLYLRFPLPYGAPFFLVAWGLMATRFPNRRREIARLEGAYDADLDGA